AIAAAQIGPDPDEGQGPFCNPYGPCEEWCALFATWDWEQIGVPIPRYPFVGSIYDWAAARGLALPPTATPVPGDAVLYGTGPQNVDTSVHVAVVAEVWPDGAITTVDGDSGPEPNGLYAVTFNGPFLPADSESYNGMPIYAFAQP
ncbi:MAG TPA: CHAP domain-containing protein, partial [Acidimicrobiales bacterium]|nr:CHAP domain-containing protein [Acidimicrobiales bacterium]